MKRFLSIMLTLVMILGMMPIMTNAATDLSVNGGRIDITDKTVGPYTLQYLDVYKQTSFEAVSIVSAVQDGTVIDVVLAEGTDPSEALQAGFGGSGQSGAMLQQSGNKCTLVNGSGTMNLSYAVRTGPQISGQGSYTVNFTTAGSSSGGESGSEDEEGGEEPSTGTELTVDNEAQYTTVNIIDQPLGSGNVTTLTIYLQSTFAKVNVDKATQDGNVINLVLAESTDPSAAIQLAVSGSGLGMPRSHSGNKVTLANGKANTEYTYSAGGNSVTYTVNLIVKGTESGEEELPATLDITTDLSEAEVMYTQGKTATALTVKAEQSKGEEVTYQWYSNTEKSTEGATAISGETSTNYTPATNEIGTTYYYAVVSSGDLIVASKIAKITVEAPVVKITTNLSEIEVKYTLGKSAAALNITAEYTGVTENAVAYQWYSYTDSAENAVAIEEATTASYTPATKAVGTTYYYAVATCEDIKATSKVAKITIEAPVVKFTTDLNESEVKYTEGKTATALTVKAEYTEKDNADVLEIAPVVKGEASKVEVKLPQESLNKVADSGLGLNVNTPVADVKLFEKAVAELATQKGELSVTASSDKDGKISIDVSVGGKSSDKIDGGLKVVLPDESKGKVMVIVNEDGTETIVTKHIAKDGEHQAMLPGSATIKMIDNHKEFTDSKGHWGKDSINFVTERELYQGVGNGKFDTEGTMTRAMLVTVLYRLEGETKANYEHNFTDVADSQWYADSVAWANENNIVKGVADNSFDPDAFVTREQVATILYRYAQYLDMSTHHKGDITQFNDHHEVSDWAKDAKSWAVGAGIIGGKPGNILDSNGNATRTEVAAIIERLITIMVK